MIPSDDDDKILYKFNQARLTKHHVAAALIDTGMSPNDAGAYSDRVARMDPPTDETWIMLLEKRRDYLFGHGDQINAAILALQSRLRGAQ